MVCAAQAFGCPETRPIMVPDEAGAMLGAERSTPQYVISAFLLRRARETLLVDREHGERLLTDYVIGIGYR